MARDRFDKLVGLVSPAPRKPLLGPTASCCAPLHMTTTDLGGDQPPRLGEADGIPPASHKNEADGVPREGLGAQNACVPGEFAHIVRDTFNCARMVGKASSPPRRK